MNILRTDCSYITATSGLLFWVAHYTACALLSITWLKFQFALVEFGCSQRFLIVRFSLQRLLYKTLLYTKPDSVHVSGCVSYIEVPQQILLGNSTCMDVVSGCSVMVKDVILAVSCSRKILHGQFTISCVCVHMCEMLCTIQVIVSCLEPCNVLVGCPVPHHALETSSVTRRVILHTPYF